jgi:Ca2+-binding RTX toxin-like protein
MVFGSGTTVERLERRVLMAVTYRLNDEGRLRIDATEGDTAGDLVELAPVGGNRKILQLWVNGLPVDPTPTPNSPATTIKRNNLRRVIADMGAGDDRVIIGRRETDPRVYNTKLSIRCTLSGGDGNDFLEGGRSDDLLIGGAGNDILLGFRGDDVLYGGSGNDQLFGETGRDNLFGQDGDDLLDGDGNEDALYGMDGADNLIGGDDEDFVNAAPGPGDTHDRNEKPDGGETESVMEYVNKLIELGVPDRFKADAKA